MRQGVESNFGEHVAKETKFREELAAKEEKRQQNIAARIAFDAETEKNHDTLKEYCLEKFRTLSEIEVLNGYVVEYSYILINKDEEGYALRPEVGITDGILSSDLLAQLSEQFDAHYLAGSVDFKIMSIRSDAPPILSVEDFQQIVSLDLFSSEKMKGRRIDASLNGVRRETDLQAFVFEIKERLSSNISDGEIQIFSLGWDDLNRRSEYELKRMSGWSNFLPDGSPRYRD